MKGANQLPNSVHSRNAMVILSGDKSQDNEHSPEMPAMRAPMLGLPHLLDNVSGTPRWRAMVAAREKLSNEAMVMTVEATQRLRALRSSASDALSSDMRRRDNAHSDVKWTRPAPSRMAWKVCEYTETVVFKIHSQRVDQRQLQTWRRTPRVERP
jgi:hypothetical protein